jgi:hypothetical protein
MSEIDLNLCIGCTTFVAASRFDDNNNDRLFVAQFGIEAGTEEFVRHGVSHRVDLWKVYVLFNDTYYTLKAADCKHNTVGNYPQCAPRKSQGSNIILFPRLREHRT